MPPDRAFSPLPAQIFLASVDKGTRGFSRGKTTPGCVILVGGRQPTCLVCLASRRLSSAKNSEGLAGTAGALPARQRTQACWRKSRTITPQAAFQPRPQACVPLSTDAWLDETSLAESACRIVRRCLNFHKTAIIYILFTFFSYTILKVWQKEVPAIASETQKERRGARSAAA